MAQLVNLARRVAKVDSTVLITGESGSGKERIARLVHEESTRAKRSDKASSEFPPVPKDRRDDFRDFGGTKLMGKVFHFE
jgi:predicted ATPase